jgi:cytochrome c6
MKVRIALLVFLGLTLLPAAFADAAKGAEIYKAKCQMCHGADGRGQTPMAKSMPIKDLGSGDIQKMHDSELKTLIENGRNKMPAYKSKLTDAQIGDVIQHLRTFKSK